MPPLEAVGFSPRYGRPRPLTSRVTAPPAKPSHSAASARPIKPTPLTDDLRTFTGRVDATAAVSNQKPHSFLWELKASPRRPVSQISKTRPFPRLLTPLAIFPPGTLQPLLALSLADASPRHTATATSAAAATAAAAGTATAAAATAAAAAATADTAATSAMDPSEAATADEPAVAPTLKDNEQGEPGSHDCDDGIGHCDGRSAEGETASVTVSDAAVDLDLTPLHLVNDSPRWLLFPQNSAYQPKALALPSSADDATYVEILDAMRRVKLFRGLTDAEVAAVVGLGRIKAFPRYACLTREGTLGASAVFLLAGQLLSVSAKGGPATLSPGASIDERCLIADGAREASVSALTACRVLILDREAIDPKERFRRPPVMSALEATPAYGELLRVVVGATLEALPFFSALVASRRAALAALMGVAYYPAGSVVFREGDQGTKFYIVSEGAVEIHKAAGKYTGSRIVSLVTPRNDRPWFGEVAMWLRKPRAGSALVVEDARLLVVDEVHFDDFLSMVPDFRPYLNKNHKQDASLAKQGDGGGAKSLDEIMGEQTKTAEQASVLTKWQSRGLLGKADDGKQPAAERSMYAERWERWVTTLLYMSESGSAALRDDGGGATVSFRTADYTWSPRAVRREHAH